MDGIGGRNVLASALVAVILTIPGCGGASSPSPSTSPSNAPSPAASAVPSATTAPTPTVGPTATPGLETTSAVDIVFEEPGLNEVGRLDVLWPVAPGPWPVAVMFHGGGVNKSYLSTHAWKVARAGYVVFVPNWGMSGGAAYDALPPHEQVEADARQAACAIAFVAQEAPKYGGDPSWITVLGHSAGANIVSIVALTTPEPSAGCFAPTRRDADAAIFWEGDWFMAGTPGYWDPIHQADPATFDAITPWAHIAERPDLPVVLLESSHPGLGRDGKDALGPEGWLTVRDPTGAFTAAFDAMGAFADDWVDLREMQAVLADQLEEAGNLVSYDVMPESTHDRVSPQGFVVMIDAFDRLRALGG